MSVYSNETISQRFKSDFAVSKPSLSHEAKAVLAAAAIWTVLLGAIALHDVPGNAGVHSSSNVEDIRVIAPQGFGAAAARSNY